MSINSRSDSSSSEKGKRSGFRITRKQSQGETSDAIKKEISRITDSVKSAGKSLGSSIHSAISNVNQKKETNVYSRGIPELDDYGYEKYNISDDTEIFISRMPEKALFNEGEPVIVRATMGNFVGPSEKQRNDSHKDPSVTNVRMDKRDLFPNAVFGDGDDRVIKADIGVVEDDGTVHVTGVPVNDLSERSAEIEAIIKDMNVGNNYSMQAEPEKAVDDVVSADPISEPAVEDQKDVAPVEAPVRLEAAPIDDADSVDDPDMMIMNMEGVPVETTETKVVEAPVDVVAPVQESPAVAPVEAPVEKVRDEFLFEPVIETTEEASGPQDSDDDWKYIDVDTDESAEASEPVVEEPVVAVPVMPVLPKADMDIEGLYTEGNKVSSDAVAAGSVIASSETEKAVTSATCEAPKAVPLAIKNLEEENVLPPMDDPKVHRPTRYRAMKFSNGKLENVTDKRSESNEGLRGPFDKAVGQTVVRSGHVERLPPVRPVRQRITIEDEIGGIMRLTVPELDLDEDSSTVEFGEAVFPDDGLEEICFRQIHPVVMEMPVPEHPALPMATSVHALAAAEPVIRISPPAEAVLIPAAPVVSEKSVEEDIPVQHAVVFSFGGSGSEGSVCFSF